MRILGSRNPSHALVLGLAAGSFALSLADATADVWLGGRLNRERALRLAEAALQESFGALCHGGTGSIGSPNDPVYLGTAVLWVEAIPLGGARTRLVSTAVVGGGRHAVEALVLHPHGEAPLLVALPRPP